MSDFNQRVIRLSKLAAYIKHHAKVKQPVMIWGPPGVGKSEVVDQIRLSYPGKTKLIDMRLSLYEPTDLRGYPVPDMESKQMIWFPPSDLPTEQDAKEYDHIVLLLDELNGAMPATLLSAYQLILNRKLGSYTLPDNVIVVAAGNRESDKGVTYRMPKPLANRFVHYEVAANYDDWFDWAVNNNIHPDVIGYITVNKQSLYTFDPKSAERSFATPRSWTFVSNLLHDSDYLSSDEITDMVAGTIGDGLAVQFKAHRAISTKLPNPSHILNGTVTELKTKEISAMFTLTTSMAYELKSKHDQMGREVSEAEFLQMMDNCFGFWMKNFEPEMIVMSVKMLFSKYNVNTNINLRKMANWPEFMKGYGDLIASA